MRWFKTPEEYLEDYNGYRVFRDYPGPVRCPNCGEPRKHKFLGPRPGGDAWHCRRWSCLTVFIVPIVEKRRVPMTPEQYVLNKIDGDYKWGHLNLQRLRALPGGTQVKGPGLLDGLAAADALTGNLENAAVLEGLQMYGRHRNHQVVQGEVSEFEAEHQHALRLADEYFGISQRQAAAEQLARGEELRELGRIIAQEIVAEARSQRV